jgi:NADH:ubiquinone oxidoreductase subunit C
MQDVVQKIKERFLDKILKFEERSALRIYIDFKPDDIPQAAQFIFKDLGLRLVTATGIDTPFGIEILYHFSHDSTGKVVSLRTFITDKKHPEIASITPIIRGAEWIEREMWELLGINFIGHPNLTHLLLIDDWPEGKHPLRKGKV